MSGYRIVRGADWMRGEGEECDVVVSTRVRLARNFAGFQFVNRAGTSERRDLLDFSKERLVKSMSAEEVAWIDLNAVESLTRAVLVERHLISNQHARGTEPRAVAIGTPSEHLSVMVNEEDHLRMQALRGGLALRDAFDDVDALDDRVESAADFAYSPRFGYLTACPTNVGTGIRVSIMFHLPALKLTGELEKVKRAAQGMSLAIRGYYGEGSEAVGDLYQISNQTTLGKSEREILGEFENDIVPRVIEYERLARRSLLEKRKIFMQDKVHRAMGILTNARMLKAEEAMELLSQARMGLVAEMLSGEDISTLNQLVLSVQPAHLQTIVGEALDQSQRRIERASLVRRTIGGLREA